ncbi:MAG: DUF1631 family protein, partial [Burkholderiales bacterium]|nr:DUF1631 family protein [Burkholderiales bacterium]
MSSPSSKPSSGNASALPSSEVLRGLIPVATHLAVAQLDAFSARLANALLALSEQSVDAKEANLSFNAGQLLKNNAYAFYYLASSGIEAAFRREMQVLQREMQVLQRDATVAPEPQDPALSLVSYEEMDKKLVLGRISRALELDSAGQYAALNMRFSHLLEREALSTSLNPFRPEV